MNAVSTLKIRSPEFIKLLDNFTEKCQQKKLSALDLSEFHQTIKNSFRHSTSDKHAVTKEHDASLDQRVEQSLKKLRNTLGSNKAIIESAAASIPLNEIEKILEDVHLYVKKQEEQRYRVGAKEKGSLPESRK